MSRMLGWIGILLPWSSLACLFWFEGIPTFSVNPRQGWLLLESLLAAGFAGTLAVVLGGGAALFAMAKPIRRLKAVSTLLVLGVALPPIVTASALLTFFGRVSPSLSQGWTPALLVQALTLAPLAGLILLLTLHSLSGDEVDSSSVFLSERAGFTKVLMPLSLPGVLAAFAATAIMALLDFTVPTLFGLTTSMVEVYSDLTVGSGGLASSWPHLLASLPCVALLGLWLSSMHRAKRSDLRPHKNLSLPNEVRAVSAAAACSLGLSFAFLLSLLAIQGLTHPQGVQSLTEALPDLGSSIKLAFFGSLCTLPFASFTGKLLSQSGSLLVWMAALAPACIPPALVGTAVAQASVWIGLEGMGQPVIAQVLRFLPFASIISALWWVRANREIEELSLVLLPPAKRFFISTLPSAAPQLLILLMAVFTLCLGELGATLMVIPPGESTLTLRLYNFLHYGSAPDSAMLTLLLLSCAFLPLSIALAARRFTRA